MSKRQSEKALQEFLSEAQDIVESLSKNLLLLDQARASGGFDPEHVNDAFRAVHSLKGLSGLFGQEAMSALSHTLETLLDSLRLGRVAVSPDLLDLLFEAVELYNQLVADSSEDRVSDATAVEDYLTRLRHVASGETESPKVLDVADLDLGPTLLSVLTEYEEHRLRENVKQGHSLFRIHASFDLMTIDKEIEALKARLKPVGEVITYLPSPEAEDPNRIDLELILGSKDGASKVRTALQGSAGAVTLIKRKARDASAQETPEPAAVSGGGERTDPRPPATVLASAPPPSAAASGSPSVVDEPISSGEERPTSLRSVSQTVRVDITVLNT